MRNESLAIRTFVHADLRRPLAQRVAVVLQEISDAPADHHGGVHQPAAATDAVAHAREMGELFLAFPYESCALLVAQQTKLLLDAPKPESSHDGAEGVAGFLAGWDGVLLLLDQIIDPLFEALLDSPFAPRLGIVMVAELQEPRFAWQLRRLAAVARSLPPARAPLSPQILHGLSALPVAWQEVVHRALRAPHDWSIKRVCSACGIDRRTLERSFRRAGLPAPKVVLDFGVRVAMLPSTPQR